MAAARRMAAQQRSKNVGVPVHALAKHMLAARRHRIPSPPERPTWSSRVAPRGGRARCVLWRRSWVAPAVRTVAKRTVVAAGRRWRRAFRGKALFDLGPAADVRGCISWRTRKAGAAACARRRFAAVRARSRNNCGALELGACWAADLSAAAAAAQGEGVHSRVHEERAATFASGAGRGALHSWICVRSAQLAGAAGRGGCGCRRCWGHIAISQQAGGS